MELMKDQNKVQSKFLNLINENKRIIYKICNSYCRNKSDHEDLVQEIIYNLWKSYPGFDPDYKFTTWMYRISLNTAISHYRREKYSGDKISIDEDSLELAYDDSNKSDENALILQKFISELKELDRALMILYLEDKSYKEIGEVLGISESNVGTKINRIKEKLKQEFKKVNIN